MCHIGESKEMEANKPQWIFLLPIFMIVGKARINLDPNKIYTDVMITEWLSHSIMLQTLSCMITTALKHTLHRFLPWEKN